MEPQRTDYLIGCINPDAVAATYRCGHCNSETGTYLDDNGITHIAVHHDDGCPVLAGTLSTTPDTLRALASTIPATFRA